MELLMFRVTGRTWARNVQIIEELWSLSISPFSRLWSWFLSEVRKWKVYGFESLFWKRVSFHRLNSLEHLSEWVHVAEPVSISLSWIWRCQLWSRPSGLIHCGGGGGDGQWHFINWVLNVCAWQKLPCHSLYLSLLMKTSGGRCHLRFSLHVRGIPLILKRVPRKRFVSGEDNIMRTLFVFDLESEGLITSETPECWCILSVYYCTYCTWSLLHCLFWHVLILDISHELRSNSC